MRSLIVMAVLIALTTVMVADVSANRMNVIDAFMLGFASDWELPDRLAAQHLREGVLVAHPGLVALEVEAGAGSIQITGADTAQVRASYQVRVLASTSAEASAHAEAIAIDLTAHEGRGRLTVREPSIRPLPIGRVEVDLLVEIPRGLSLEVNGAGKLTIRGAGCTRVNNFGPVVIGGVNNFGPVVIGDLSGDLVAGVVGGLRADGIAGSATVDVRGGQVALAEVAGDVEVNARVPTRVEVRDVGGRLNGEFVGGELEVSGVRGQLFIRSRLTLINLRDVGGPADISLTHGGVTFTGPVNDVRIDGAGGHVRVLLGPDAGYRVRGTVSGGFFLSDFPLQVTRENSTDRVEGVIGDGGRALDINTDMGSVEIRRLTWY